MLTEAQKAENRAINLARGAELKDILRKGDVLMHTICGGIVEEHIWTGWDGSWLCGTATRATRIAAHKGGWSARSGTDDIAPRMVTHINRVPVDVVIEERRAGRD